MNSNLDVLSGSMLIGSVADALKNKMRPGENIRLEGCNNASGESNIVRSISKKLPELRATDGSWYQLGYEYLWLFGNSSGSFGPKRTCVDGVEQD